jgi:hypothetical protein
MNKGTTDLRGRLERCSGGAPYISRSSSVGSAGDRKATRQGPQASSCPLDQSGPHCFVCVGSSVLLGVSSLSSASAPAVLAVNYFDLLVFIEVHQKDLALRVEVVGRPRQLPAHRVLYLHVRHEPSPPLAPLARERPPRRPIVPPPSTIRALPKALVTDGYRPSHRLSALIANSSGRRSALP